MRGIAGEPDGATPLDPDDMEGLKFRHVMTRGELNELEQANITNGLYWLDRARKRDVLDAAWLRELHRRLFGEVWRWAGTFRRTEKNIGVDPSEIAPQLAMLLGDAGYWAENNSYAPLEAGARFHHRLVQIHLFPNGNGRHARIAADVFMTDGFGHAPIDWAAGENIQSSGGRREAYIAALRAADAGNYNPLLSFVGA